MTGRRVERPNLAGLRVRSARLSYGGPGRLDVTTRSAHPLGRLFAPSGDLFRSGSRERQRAANILLRAAKIGDDHADARERLVEQAQAIEDAMWPVYEQGYLAERRLHAGLVAHRGWDDLSDLEQMAWRRGVRQSPEDWMRLREVAWVEPEGPLLVFVCFCPEALRHHSHTRTLCHCCSKLGAIDEGEVPLNVQRKQNRNNA